MRLPFCAARRPRAGELPVAAAVLSSEHAMPWIVHLLYWFFRKTLAVLAAASIRRRFHLPEDCV